MSKVRDQLQIAGHITVRRFFNLISLRLSYTISKIVKRPMHFGLPFAASIEPTTACNLGCPECPSGLKQFTRATGKIDTDFHEQILREIHPTVFYINYYFQGEPFLHPQFLALIRQAKRYNIYTSTSTNAHFIDDKKAEEIVTSKLDRLIISIDGATQETYENYRIHGQLHKVIEGTKNIVQAKKRLNSSTPHIIFQMLIVKPNEHEMNAVRELGEQLGVDEVRYKSAQFYNYESGNPLMPDSIEFSRYKKQADGSYKLKYKLGNKCWRMWSSTVLTWDGKIVPCCFDKDAKHIVGDVRNQPFLSVWKGSKLNAFRAQLIKNRKSIDICTNCSEGSKVWV